MSPFGIIVRSYRNQKGISLKTLANALGVTSTFLSALERGKRRKPSRKIVDGIISFFNLDNDRINELEEAVRYSDTRPKIPSDARPEVYTAIHNMIMNADDIQDYELQIINLLTCKRVESTKRRKDMDTHITSRK